MADAAEHADPSLIPLSDQQPGELQAACAAELASPAGGWPASLAPDRAAAIRRLALSTFLQDRLALPALARGKLTDPIGVAGAFVDGGLAGRAIVEGRRVLQLPFAERGQAINSLPPELRVAVEALLHVPGWAGPAWMDTSDGFGGFKKLHYFPNIALAVSKTGKMEAGTVYEAPGGWHWGSRAEVEAIVGGGMMGREPAKQYYRDQGGWRGYTWGGVWRCYFLFSDTLQVGGCLTPCSREGHIYTDYSAPWLAQMLPTHHFAGIVCVAD